MLCTLFATLIYLTTSESIVDIINSKKGLSWKAREYPDMSFAKFRSRLGAMDLTRQNVYATVSNDLPDAFDARTQWNDVFLGVRDQGSCGSCWAFAVAETTGNRLGINGCGKGDMSPQDLVACDTLDLGCNGGSTILSWTTMQYQGITTEACIPYASYLGTSPACPSVCVNGSAIIRTRANSFSQILPANMQSELYNYGPYEVAFYVFTDFYAYSSGVYYYVYGDYLGGHAVMLIGWGTESGVPYWTIQNSWGDYWGEAGFFRIRRGTDECGIESNAFAGYFSC